MADVSATQVKQLREMTGAGMMDAKRALVEVDGDIEKAKDLLRQRGLAKAAGKAGRTANEGLVDAYIHHSGGVGKQGAMVEVNCESDFVARTADFKHLAHELALQVVGARPQYVRREDIPGDVLERERSIYRAQVEGKPANIVDKILAGKLEDFYKQVCLLDQEYIREKGKKVGDLVAEAVAKLGENITVARFARFEVGETSENGAAAPSQS